MLTTSFQCLSVLSQCKRATVLLSPVIRTRNVPHQPSKPIHFLDGVTLIYCRRHITWCMWACWPFHCNKTHLSILKCQEKIRKEKKRKTKESEQPCYICLRCSSSHCHVVHKLSPYFVLFMATSSLHLHNHVKFIVLNMVIFQTSACPMLNLIIITPSKRTYRDVLTSSSYAHYQALRVLMTIRYVQMVQIVSCLWLWAKVPLHIQHSSTCDILHSLTYTMAHK